MYNPNTLGKFLRLKRKEFNLRIADVAMEVGLPSSSLSHIERGNFHSPSPYNLEKLAPFFNMSAVDLANMIDLPSEIIQKYLDDHE